MGRPKKLNNNEETKELFESLCKLQCTEEEICSVFDVTDKTLCSWCNEAYGMGFSEIYKKKRVAGLQSLRRFQWNLARTNVSMAIFLGKQYLNQKDNHFNKNKQNEIDKENKE